MDIKLILKKCKGLDKEIDANLELLERLKAQEESCTSQLSDMPHGTGKTDKTKITDKRIMLENELSLTVVNFYEHIEKSKRYINSIPNTNQRTVLTHYYLNNKSWEEIRIITNYTYPYLQKLHSKGLQYLRMEVIL